MAGKTGERVRALLAVGLGDTVTVVATDSGMMAQDVDEVSCEDRAEEMSLPGCGAIRRHNRENGRASFWLWEGVLKGVRPDANGGDWSDCEYVGKVRPVTADELPALLAMTPPTAAEGER